MESFPRGGLIGKAVQTAGRIGEMEIPLRAAYAAYFIVLSVFPALLLILSLLRYTSLQVTDLMELLGDFLPEALHESAEELVYSTYRNSSGAVAGLSALTALWSSSRAIYGLLTGLNSVYGVGERRSYFYTRAISFLYAIAFLAVMLLTLVLHVFGNGLYQRMRMVNDPVVIFLTDLIDFRFILLLVLQTLLFTAMYMFLPNRRSSFLQSIPGGLLSSIGWLVFSDLFSMYVAYFPRYANIYGSIYGIALSMLWLYSCMSILLYGGALNRYLRKNM